jgi:hypothetical protein
MSDNPRHVACAHIRWIHRVALARAGRRAGSERQARRPLSNGRNEIFIADGYINKRVVVYDAATGKYKRHWGAYGRLPEYLVEKFVRPETGGSGSGFSLQFSRDTAQSLLYLIDGTNQRIWILRRKDLTILDRFGKPGRQAGEFIRAHVIAIDSKSRIYTGEAAGCSAGF